MIKLIDILNEIKNWIDESKNYDDNDVDYSEYEVEGYSICGDTIFELHFVLSDDTSAMANAGYIRELGGGPPIRLKVDPKEVSGKLKSDIISIVKKASDVLKSKAAGGLSSSRNPGRIGSTDEPDLKAVGVKLYKL